MNVSCCVVCVIISMRLSVGYVAHHIIFVFFFFFSSRRRHTRLQGDWSSDVCSSDLVASAIFLSTWCHSEPMGGVPLTVVRDNTNAIVSWPYPSTGFELESSTNLSTTNWHAAAETSVSNSLRWAVTAPVSPPSRFFRLKNHLQHFGFWAGSVAAGGAILVKRGL